MWKFPLLLAVCSATLASASVASGSVSVSAPSNGSNVSTTVQYVATATSSCSKGVSAMGIYTAPGVLAYTVQGNRLNTELNLSPGTYNTVVQEWDNCGSASTTPITIHVAGNSAEVNVSSPKNNSTGYLAYKASGASLNTLLTLNPGTYNTVVQEWDNCNGSASTPVTIQVGGSGGGSGQVVVTAPTANSSVSSNVQYVASATSPCSKGVSAMGIYTAPGALAYTTQGAKLNTTLTLGPGVYHTVVQEWDNCGGSVGAPLTITVGGGGGNSGSFPNLQADVGGWTGYGLLPPSYNICSSCVSTGPQITW